MKKQFFGSNAPWEKIVGYSRAVRTGNVIEVSGTTSVNDDVVSFQNDMAGQTRCILDKIVEVIESAGGKRQDVVRTRMYVTDISKWEEAGRVHGEYFHDTLPATTMVEVSKLIHPDMLIEIEATAVIEE